MTTLTPAQKRQIEVITNFGMAQGLTFQAIAKRIINYIELRPEQMTLHLMGRNWINFLKSDEALAKRGVTFCSTEVLLLEWDLKSITRLEADERLWHEIQILEMIFQYSSELEGV